MGKLIRAVLRGRDGGNTILLPDTLAVALEALLAVTIARLLNTPAQQASKLVQVRPIGYTIDITIYTKLRTDREDWGGQLSSVHRRADPPRPPPHPPYLSRISPT